MNICEMNFLWNELFVKWTFCEMNFCEMNFCEMILFVKWLVLWNDTFVKWTFVKRYICEMNFCETMHPRYKLINFYAGLAKGPRH